MFKKILQKMKLTLIFMFVLSLGSGGFYIGLVGPKMVMANAQEKYAELQLFAKVLNLVQQYYVEDVSVKKLIYGGVKGMLSELDPHTNFLPPKIFKEFQNETSGEFGGLGIEITVKNQILTIISPIEDTPAWKAGIKSGDKVIKINGESTKGLSLAEAAQKMKGKRGTKITLTVYREGEESPLDIVVTRGVVKLKSVKYVDLEGGYAYARITGFMEKTSRDLIRILKNHEKKRSSSGGTKGLILDLRRNPGGLLDQAVKISDLFLNKGIIVSTIGRNKKEKEVLYAKKSNTLEEYPIIVLIDEFSASASEIVAGALQDHKRALVMGQQSFGKGSVQSVVKLGDGSGLKLTVARYYTPSGRSIQASGITPDIEVESYDAKLLQSAVQKKNIRREKDIRGHLESEKEKAAKKAAKSKDLWWLSLNEKKDKDLSPKDRLLKKDFQVLQAYNYLKAWKVIKGQ